MARRHSRSRRSRGCRRSTLEMIQRVIFGSQDPELSGAARSALDLTGSTPNLIAMSLVQKTSARTAASSPPSGASTSSCTERIDEPGDGDSILDLLKGSGRDARRAPRPARDAARRRPRDDGHRARLGARAARAPPDGPRHDDDLDAVHQGGPAHPPGALHHRPQDPAAVRARRATRSREGVYVAPCIYLAHRRPARAAIPVRAAARAAASAPRSPHWRCARCYEP